MDNDDVVSGDVVGDYNDLDDDDDEPLDTLKKSKFETESTEKTCISMDKERFVSFRKTFTFLTHTWYQCTLWIFQILQNNLLKIMRFPIKN